MSQAHHEIAHQSRNLSPSRSHAETFLAFANSVEKGELGTGAEVVVPQETCRFFAEDAIFDVRGNLGVGGVRDGFTPADCAILEGQFAELDVAPTRNPVLEMLVALRGEGQVEVTQLDIGYFHV